MKKLMAIAILFLLATVGYANAQSVMRGPLRFTITSTDETPIKDTYGNDTGYSKLVTEKMTFNGHIDFNHDTPEQDVFLNIKVYDDSENLVIECPGQDVIRISAKGNNTKAAVKDKVKLMVTNCQFYPEEGIEGMAYMVLDGTMTRPKGADMASKVTVNGTVGGGTDLPDYTFIFNGTFKTVVKPVIP
jgi:hypothetical protein